MKRFSTLFYLGITWLMAACASSSTSGIDLTVSRGDATAAYSGSYIGTISLTSTAGVVGIGSSTDQRIETALIEVTADGLVFLNVRNVIMTGVVDNSGNWGVQASINDLSSLISAENTSNLNNAGCSLATKAARIQGVISPPAMQGNVSGSIKCKRAGLTVATLATSGTLTANR